MVPEATLINSPQNKIGSGQGLILKGYGLYFTDMKGAAEGYALKRADRDKYLSEATKGVRDSW